MQTLKDSHLSCFDLDKTLFKGNSSYNFGAYLYRIHGMTHGDMLQSLLFYGLCRAGLFNLYQLHQKTFNCLFRGRPLSFFEMHANRYFQSAFSELVNPVGYQVLLKAKQEGHFIVLLSSAPEFVVRPIAKLLGIEEYKATEYRLDDEGRCLSIAKIVDGHVKADLVQEFAARFKISLQDVTAYSDSYLDLPFLLAAGNRVAVNPDKRLRQISEENAWRIL